MCGAAAYSNRTGSGFHCQEEAWKTSHHLQGEWSSIQYTHVEFPGHLHTHQKLEAMLKSCWIYHTLKFTRLALSVYFRYLVLVLCIMRLREEPIEYWDATLVIRDQLSVDQTNINNMWLHLQKVFKISCHHLLQFQDIGMKSLYCIMTKCWYLLEAISPWVMNNELDRWAYLVLPWSQPMFLK